MEHLYIVRSKPFKNSDVKEECYQLNKDGILTNETAKSFVGRDMTPARCEGLFRFFMQAEIVEHLEI